MKVKKKKCKGTGKATGSGCGEQKYIVRYGLCQDCLTEWLLNSDEGGKILEKYRISAHKKTIKKYKQEAKKQKEQAKNKSYYQRKLQTEINAIVRLIDIDCSCISCGYSGTGRQFHAGHYHSVGGHADLRYNLHNIHKQCSICNNHLSGNIKGYQKGLINRYGRDYLEFVENLPAETHKKLDIQELKELIIKAKKIHKEILSGIDYKRNEIHKILFG